VFGRGVSALKLYYETPDGRAKLYHGDARRLTAIEDRSVDLVVTSPPYNLGRPYDAWEDKLPLDEYLAFLRVSMGECFRVLKNGGRLCLNIGASGRDFPLDFMGQQACMEAGFRLRDEIIWESAELHNRRALGTWGSPKNPCLLSPYEHIYFYSKGEHGRNGDHRESDLTNPEHFRWSYGIWKMRGASHKVHPAPMPEELVWRAIKLCSFINDVVLDPFVGTGTVCRVALNLARRAIGVDISALYLEMTKNKLLQGVLL